MTTASRHTVPPDLNGRHRHTYEAIFRHPAAHNLEWHDVRSLLAAVAGVVEESNGAIRVTRNGQSVFLHAPKHKDVATIDDLMTIRHFLEQSSDTASATPILPGDHLLIVIDHHEAKVYRTEFRGAKPQQLVPYDPYGYRRHLHYAQEWTDGKRLPEKKSFYDAIVKTLQGGEHILVFGRGTGRSSAMDHLLAELAAHHPVVAKKVVGAVDMDTTHTNENQLLAAAREFYDEYVPQPVSTG